MNRDFLHLELMLASIDAIRLYILNVDENEFSERGLIQDACLMRLIVIGESAARMSDEVKERFPEVEWREMRLARNFYAHGYDTVDWSRIWTTIATVLPPLRSKIETVLLEIDKQGES